MNGRRCDGLIYLVVGRHFALKNIHKAHAKGYRNGQTTTNDHLFRLRNKQLTLQINIKMTLRRSEQKQKLTELQVALFPVSTFNLFCKC